MAPKLFIVLIDSNGVAFGAASISNQIRIRLCTNGMRSCLKLYATWLFPKPKPYSTGLFHDLITDAGWQFLEHGGDMVLSDHTATGTGVQYGHSLTLHGI